MGKLSWEKIKSRPEGKRLHLKEHKKFSLKLDVGLKGM